jgi:hypothetical protein
MLCLLYSFFWVIPQHLNFMYRRFGTLCMFTCRLNGRERDRVFRNVGTANSEVRKPPKERIQQIKYKYV